MKKLLFLLVFCTLISCKQEKKYDADEVQKMVDQKVEEKLAENNQTETKNNTKDKEISISLTEEEILDKKYAILEIKDNAGGISNENLEKIFEPYFTTKHKSQGTGLGLFMSKMIIEKSLEGELSHKNCDDGSIFIIKLILG